VAFIWHLFLSFSKYPVPSPLIDYDFGKSVILTGSWKWNVWKNAESYPFSKRLDVDFYITGSFLGGQVFIDLVRSRFLFDRDLCLPDDHPRLDIDRDFLRLLMVVHIFLERRDRGSKPGFRRKNLIYLLL
jgi:hypothetical protein